MGKPWTARSPSSPAQARGQGASEALNALPIPWLETRRASWPWCPPGTRGCCCCRICVHSARPDPRPSRGPAAAARRAAGHLRRAGRRPGPGPGPARARPDAAGPCLPQHRPRARTVQGQPGPPPRGPAGVGRPRRLKGPDGNLRRRSSRGPGAAAGRRCRQGHLTDLAALSSPEAAQPGRRGRAAGGAGRGHRAAWPAPAAVHRHRPRGGPVRAAGPSRPAVVVAPPLAYGSSGEHEGFAGTISSARRRWRLCSSSCAVRPR